MIKTKDINNNINEKIEINEENIRYACINKENRLIPVKYAQFLESYFHYFYQPILNKFLIYDWNLNFYVSGAEDQIKEISQKQIPNYLNSFNLKEVINHVKRNNYHNNNNEYLINSKKNINKNDLINLKNCVYDIKSKEILSASPDYYFTYALSFEYNKDAFPNKILKFIWDITDNNMADFITILQGIAYLFIPGYPIRKSFMLVGNGANGKSTLLKVMTKFLGRELVGNEDLGLLNDVGGFYLANIYGKWANFGNDLPKKMLKETSNFKSLTTGDRITAHKKFVQEEFNFISRAKLWFACNQIPGTADDSDAYFSRWIVINFNKQYTDSNILDSLTTDNEFSGLFNVIMQLFYPLLKKQYKFSFAPDITATREAYLNSSDLLKLFKENCLVKNDDTQLSKNYIYEQYCKFVKIKNKKAIDLRQFWRQLRNLIEFDIIKPFNQERFVIGLKVVDYEVINEDDDNVKPATNNDIVEQFKALITKYKINYGFDKILDTIDYKVCIKCGAGENENNKLCFNPQNIDTYICVNCLQKSNPVYNK